MGNPMNNTLLGAWRNVQHEWDSFIAATPGFKYDIAALALWLVAGAAGAFIGWTVWR